MSIAHAIILSLLQGAFELFPVSSLGHTVIVPALLGWHEKQSDPSFLAFVVVLHLGTAAALLIFFWRDWLRIIGAVLRSISARHLSDDPNERLGWLIVAGSIPAGVLGLFLKTPLNKLFGQPWLVAIFLVLNGFVLVAGERLRQRSISPALVAAGGHATEARLPIARLGFPAAFGIGGAQALALLPGFSRSGASMVGGLQARLNHVDAARFSFLLATPLILAAGALETPEVFKSNSNIGPGLAAMGMVISGITAFLAVRFLLRFFETERLDIFGYYCFAFGAFSFIVLGLRHAL
ncbi:MAG: undecaprenyl-diphosphate phosphatase [Dehalococcoidia bacterium]